MTKILLKSDGDKATLPNRYFFVMTVFVTDTTSDTASECKSQPSLPCLLPSLNPFSSMSLYPFPYHPIYPTTCAHSQSSEHTVVCICKFLKINSSYIGGKGCGKERRGSKTMQSTISDQGIRKKTKHSNSTPKNRIYRHRC